MDIIIVEDNLIQRELLEMYVRKLDHEVIGLFDNGELLIEFLDHNSADLVLMDININGLKNGIETTKEIGVKYGTSVIYTTAQTEFSVLDNAADTNPLDILIKPFSIEQLHASILLSKHRLPEKKESQNNSRYVVKNDYFVYKDGHMFERLPLSELRYLEGDGNYFNLYFQNKKSTLKGTLSEMEKHLPESNFIRINRSIIIAMKEVTSFNNRRVVLTSGEEFTLSKSHGEEVISKLMGA